MNCPFVRFFCFFFVRESRAKCSTTEFVRVFAPVYRDHTTSLQQGVRSKHAFSNIEMLPHTASEVCFNPKLPAPATLRRTPLFYGGSECPHAPPALRLLPFDVANKTLAVS